MRVQEFLEALTRGGGDADELRQAGEQALLGAVDASPGGAAASLANGPCVSSQLSDVHTAVLCLRPQGDRLELVVRGLNGQSLLLSDVCYPESADEDLHAFARRGARQIAQQITQSLSQTSEQAQWGETGLLVSRWLANRGDEHADR